MLRRGTFQHARWSSLLDSFSEIRASTASIIPHHSTTQRGSVEPNHHSTRNKENQSQSEIKGEPSRSSRTTWSSGSCSVLSSAGNSSFK